MTDAWELVCCARDALRNMIERLGNARKEVVMDDDSATSDHARKMIANQVGLASRRP